MTLSEDKQRFYQQILPSRPNDWQVDDIFSRLAEIEEPSRQALLDHVPAIWPVSHSLCFAYLEEGAKSLELLPTGLLAEWVRQILGFYEKRGLAGAREYMAGVDKYFLGPRRGMAGSHFSEIAARLIPFLHGISGLPLECATAFLPSTDTRTVFLPSCLEVFPEKDKNILLYTVLVSLQWGHIASRVYPDAIAGIDQPVDPLARYPDRQLALDLLAVLQFIKVYRFLERELPGLMRRAAKLCSSLVDTITPLGQEKERCEVLHALLSQAIGRPTERRGLLQACALQLPFWLEAPWSLSSLEVLPDFYAYASTLSGGCLWGHAALLLGEFDFGRAGVTIERRREAEKAQFIAMLSAVIQGKLDPRNGDGGGQVSKQERSVDILLLLRQLEANKNQKAENRQMHSVDTGADLPEELGVLANALIDDLGSIPEAYVQAAAGMSGGGKFKKEEAQEKECGPSATSTALSYNEWDYRRGGYRDRWCTLYEKVLEPVGSNFIAMTLEKYRAQHKRLRRQFAMLRPSHRVVRRRRYGDDIDLDALIEAFCDTRAGLAPSDRLFTRSLRVQRDITTMLLVDMSYSTEGWIGLALKEALVLLAEALEEVGDSYGIYGFSGMRRSKCELYEIKNCSQTYSPLVQGRIAAISPKEYTRMGPPIRHLTQKLLGLPGKVRLLLVISDGKPEDYDDYKGQYAIEDTRKALLEARGLGVSSFCVTIDKAAHEYLPHMFGRGNYIFIDKVQSLPAKMAEMYRLLTG